MTMDVGAIADLHGARVLGLFGDSITTDHISPAGNIKHDSPAGTFLQSRAAHPAAFNRYGPRRRHDDVMVPGTLPHIRPRNPLPDGGESRHSTTLGQGDTPPHRQPVNA